MILANLSRIPQSHRPGSPISFSRERQISEIFANLAALISRSSSAILSRSSPVKAVQSAIQESPAPVFQTVVRPVGNAAPRLVQSVRSSGAISAAAIAVHQAVAGRLRVRRVADQRNHLVNIGDGHGRDRPNMCPGRGPCRVQRSSGA